MASLGWSIFLMMIFGSMIAIYFMELAMHFLQDDSYVKSAQNATHCGDITDLESLEQNWNGIYNSIMTLVFAVTGGNDWQPLACPFFHMGDYGVFHGMVFTFFIFTST